MAARSQSSLSALLKRSTIDDHEEILEACNAALKQNQSDNEAQHARIVAFLKLDKFAAAREAVEAGGDALKQVARLEYAYALYKLGEYGTARVTARGGKTRGCKHLEAQADYRLEDFHSAAVIWRQLASDGQGVSNEDSDLRINSTGADAQLVWKGKGNLTTQRKAEREDSEAFELAYNVACGYIARGQLGRGEVMLKIAKDLCNSSEDISSEDKIAEILPITIQQIYVLILQGKNEEATKLLDDIDITNISDPSTKYIAQINRLAADTRQFNPYLAQRISSTSAKLPSPNNLFEFQENLSERNTLASDILASKFAGVKSYTDRIHTTKSEPTTSALYNSFSVASATAHAQNQVGRSAISLLLPLLEKWPKDVGILLVLVQLYMLNKNHGAAINVTEAFFKRLEESGKSDDKEVRFAPGLVAMLISLYSIEKRTSHIRAELAEAAKYWRDRSKGSSEVLRAAGLALLESSNEADLLLAGEIFEELHKQAPSDRVSTAGLVAAYSTLKPEKLSREADQLTPINKLTAGIDVAALEKLGIPQAKSRLEVLNKKRAAESQAHKPGKKRIRKSKLPKDFDPSKKADPERWLPLRDRSTYKPKGRKGKQKAQASTQGGIVDKGSDRPETPDTKPASTVIGAGGGGGGGKAKKKKPKK